MGLLLTALECDRVTLGTPFARPRNPPPLVIPGGATQHAASCMRKDHAEDLRRFREYEDMEAALKKQITTVIEYKHTKCFRNRTT